MGTSVAECGLLVVSTNPLSLIRRFVTDRYLWYLILVGCVLTDTGCTRDFGLVRRG